VLHADRTGRVRDFRLATALSAVVPIALSLYVSDMDVSRVVGLAFAVAASSFCPLLVLGIWWRGLTAAGAAAGILAGGGAAMAAVLVTVLGPPLSGWPAQFIGEPAAWTVPLAFTVMVVGSLLTSGRVPRNVGATMLRLHAPESLRL
jgi:cation/acetate symporter